MKEIIRKLEEIPFVGKDVQVTVGFDGFVDSIVRAIKNVDSRNSFLYFDDISEFGTYLAGKKGKSCALELDEKLVKAGGNMPIFANAMGNLGIKVNCIGAMGFPDIHPVFRKVSPNCTLYSVANPGTCTALEFNDGKIMLASNSGINNMSWNGIKDFLGLDTLIRFYSDSRIIGMFNWSELNCSTQIWEGIVRDILPRLKPDFNRIMFFDLSDCSKRHRTDILHALELIMQFRSHYNVILSLNENETECVYQALNPGQGIPDLEDVGDFIYNMMGIGMLVIHSIRFSLAWNKDGRYKVDNLYVEKPLLSTGGGDNFNAGLCLALLINADAESSLVIASAASSYYVNNGNSATINELIKILNRWQIENFYEI